MNHRSLHSSLHRGAPLLFSSLPQTAHLKQTAAFPQALRTFHHPSDVFSAHHSAVLSGGAWCWGVGRQCEIRGELPGQMQPGAVWRDAAVRTDGPGWLRLLPGLRGRQRGALLPHSVGDARGEVRTGVILRVLQGRGRLWRRIWDLQRYIQIEQVIFLF